MVYETIETLLEDMRRKLALEPKRLVVAAAEDSNTLQAVSRARKEGIILPTLVGNAAVIAEILEMLGEKHGDYKIVPCDEKETSAFEAVQIIRRGEAEFLMKGKLDTSAILRPVVNKTTGIGKGGTISYCGMMQLPGYHKLLLVTDCAIVISPTLEQRRHILLNAVEVMHALGCETPKVALLAASEHANIKMPETIDAIELKRQNAAGEIAGCAVEGPISFDITMSPDIAKLKGFSSPVVGDTDILVFPDLAAANLTTKALSLYAKARMIPFVVGAKVPLVVPSRGSSAESKYVAIVANASIAKRLPSEYLEI